MITSALIAECRREFGDNPKSTRVSKLGDGSSTLYNTGEFPIIEGSYSFEKGTSAMTEGTDFTIDLDTGDISLTSALASNIELVGNLKYAHWRDANWNDAIGNGIDNLNARGFFKQIVRNPSLFKISANVSVYSGPSACVDIYELLESADNTPSGRRVKFNGNWSYQQDENKIVIAGKPSTAKYCSISYLRNLQKYSATSATIDVKDEWIGVVKKIAGSDYYRELAAKVAKAPHANIDEGHYSFSNLRTMANDLSVESDRLALRKKPTRPAKEIQFNIPGAGD
jgi:hypothetical protein